MNLQEKMLSTLPCSRCDNISGKVEITTENEVIIIRFICDNCGKILYEERLNKKLSL